MILSGSFDYDVYLEQKKFREKYHLNRIVSGLDEGGNTSSRV